MEKIFSKMKDNCKNYENLQKHLQNIKKKEE